MQYLELSSFVDRHMKQFEGHQVLDVTTFTDELYNRLTPEQREQVGRERLRKRVMELATARFGALRW